MGTKLDLIIIKCRGQLRELVCEGAQAHEMNIPLYLKYLVARDLAGMRGDRTDGQR